MVSKQNLGRGSKQTKKATLRNEKQKRLSNKEQTSAVSKQKKGRKGKATAATDLRVDESWPPKPWIKMHRKGRKGKTQCYANPETRQEYYTEADLKRHLAYLVDKEAKEAAKQLQEKDSDISERKTELDEAYEASTSDGVIHGAILEITLDSAGVEDLDHIFEEMESRETAEACVPDNAQLDLYSDFLMWDVESAMTAQAPAIADGEAII